MTRGKFSALLLCGLLVVIGISISACSSRMGDEADYLNLREKAAPAGLSQQMSIPYTDLLLYPDNWVDLTHSGAVPGGPPILPGAASNSRNEEIWVIGKSPSTPPAGIPDSSTLAATSGMSLPLPGGGTLVAKEDSGKLVPIPLKHTDVSAQITGYIASVAVTQQFENPYGSKIEAVYVFPLPENAAINEFVMTIGERHIRGIIREREEAKKIYDEARRQGYVASLMTQERPNVFTQSVANIEPGKQIDINIRYFHALSYNDGWYEWVFPMVVGPRYNPAGSAGGIGAVGVGNRGASGQRTELQYLRPNERSGHDVSLSVKLDAGVALADVTSVNHKISRRADGENSTIISLDPGDSIPNKDFVLRYKVAASKVQSALFVQHDKDKKGGTFTLMIVPPESLKGLPRRPVEMVFVVDTSGSMNGKPEAQARSAVDVSLGKMIPSDTFQIVQFDSNAAQMSPTPLSATDGNIAKGRQYVSAMEGNGGTEMLAGINMALNFPHDPDRTRVAAFFTDGYIGNEIEILKALHGQLENSRVFSFGVGTSPNRYLLDAMAVIGHGHAAYLSLNESAKPVMDAYFERISHPALANISVNFAGMQVTDVYPKRIPELFVGRPIILTGRFTGETSGEISVSGKVGGEELRFALPTQSKIAENPALSAIWARAKIADLEQESIYENRDTGNDIKEVALTHNLMSPFTSFIAVDSTRQTAGDHGTTVNVPVPVPEGVRYETTVQDRKSE